jgi:hypothetical protein
MPVTDFGDAGNNNDWLQSLLAAFGAGKPNAPGAAPGGGAGPQGVMPGGAPMGYQAGAPAPPNPFMRALNYFNPIGSAQAQEAEPGVSAMRHGMPQDPDLSYLLRYASGSPGGPAAGPGGPGTAGADAGANNPYAATAAANPPQGGPYVGSGPPGPQGTNGINPYAAAAAANPPQGGPYVGSGQPGMPGPAPAGVGGPYVGGQGRAPYDPLSSIRVSGSPSATPRPSGSSASTGTAIDRNHPLPWQARQGGQGQAASAPSPVGNPRFGLFQSEVPTGRGPLSSNPNPIYTTLNLADLFKRKS